MKRLFLILSLATLTACSSEATSQEEPKEEISEETIIEQEEIPEEDTSEYFVVETEPVSFELEQGAWIQKKDSKALIEYASVSADVYIYVQFLNKAHYFQEHGLSPDADIKEIIATEKARMIAHFDGRGIDVKYSNEKETEINGQRVVLYDTELTQEAVPVARIRDFAFLWKDFIIVVTCEAENQKDFGPFEKDFAHVFDTMTIH